MRLRERPRHPSVQGDESPALTGPVKPSATLLSDRVPQTLFSVLRDDLWAVMGRRAAHHVLKVCGAL